MRVCYQLLPPDRGPWGDAAPLQSVGVTRNLVVCAGGWPPRRPAGPGAHYAATTGGAMQGQERGEHTPGENRTPHPPPARHHPAIATLDGVGIPISVCGDVTAGALLHLLLRRLRRCRLMAIGLLSAAKCVELLLRERLVMAIAVGEDEERGLWKNFDDESCCWVCWSVVFAGLLCTPGCTPRAALAQETGKYTVAAVEDVPQVSISL